MIKYKKECIVIAGANGSGKTTFAHQLLKILNYEFVNADEIARRINPKDITKARISAGKEFLKTVTKLIQEDKSFIVETTLSGKYFEKVLSKLKGKEYLVTIIFIFLQSPDACINRITERTLKGGHYITNEDVKRRYYRSKSNFLDKYLYFADIWYLIENTGNYFEEIASGIRDKAVASNEKLLRDFLE